MSRTAIKITAGVKKAERFPVSAKRKPGQPAHRPAGDTRLTANEKAYVEGVELAWTLIPARVIQDQWLSADPGKTLGGIVDAFVPYESFLADLTLFQLNQSGSTVFNEIKKAVAADWRTLEKATPSATALAMNFNTASPAAAQYATMSSANMVQDMIQSQVQSVRSVIGRSFNDGLTRQQTSRNLVQVLNDIPTPKGIRPGNYALGVVFGDATKGLTTRYANAVYNRADKLIRQNPKMSAAELKRRSDSYGSKLRRSRARTIARTELMRASNQGRLQGMWQAADQGLVNPVAAKKQWVTSNFDVCPICVPLNGITVGLKDSFGSPGQAPPAHPNCRCTIRMLPDPLTYGLPTSTGTGQAGSPLQFVRPTRPGLKIQDVVGGPGVVGPGSRVAAVPEALAPIPRAGNISADFIVPTSKTAKETAGVVLQSMDDAGYVVSSALAAGKTQVKILKSTATKLENGSFTPAGRVSRPPRKRGATQAENEAYMERLNAWAETGGVEPQIVLRTRKSDLIGGQQNTITHEIGHRLDVKSAMQEVDVTRMVNGRRVVSRETRLVNKGYLSGKTMKAAEKAAKSKQAINETLDEAFQKLTYKDLAGEGSEEMLDLMQAALKSDAVATLSKFGGQNSDYVKYAMQPEELWARSFNQYFTARHGTVEAVEDMLKRTTSKIYTEAKPFDEQWIGFQWRPEEFERLIAPRVEKVLRAEGIIE